jgi:hypothetical protein
MLFQAKKVISLAFVRNMKEQPRSVCKLVEELVLEVVHAMLAEIHGSEDTLKLSSSENCGSYNEKNVASSEGCSFRSANDNSVSTVKLKEDNEADPDYDNDGKLFVFYLCSIVLDFLSIVNMFFQFSFDFSFCLHTFCFVEDALVQRKRRSCDPKISPECKDMHSDVHNLLSSSVNDEVMSNHFFCWLYTLFLYAFNILNYVFLVTFFFYVNSCFVPLLLQLC